MIGVEAPGKRFRSYVALLTSAFLSRHARLYGVAWITVLAVVLVDCIWMREAGFSVPIKWLISEADVLRDMTGVLLVFRFLAWLPRYRKLTSWLRIRAGCTILHAIILMMIFTYASLVLQYLCVSLAPPLIDSELIALDSALGFHWLDLFRWQSQHHMASNYLKIIYQSYFDQILLIDVVLGFSALIDDLADFLMLFIFVVIAAILISAPFPAANPLIHFGYFGPHDVSPWSKFFALRERSISVFDFNRNQGLVSMPSLHAAFAVLFIYAVRHVRPLFWVSIVWNIAMIYAALLFGAHYLADIIAGVMLSMASIAALRYAKRRLADQPIPEAVPQVTA